MAKQGGAAKPQQEEVDVASLSVEKIKMLMRNDPRFISRLIGQLDKTMHNMMREKQRRLEQIRLDKEDIAKIDGVIKNHIQLNLDRLNAEIADKTQRRDNLVSQLGTQKKNLRNMEAETAAIISSARSQTTKLMRHTASQRLEETRGFTSRIPTTTLMRSGLKGKDGGEAGA